jgi:hypothetical protein
MLCYTPGSDLLLSSANQGFYGEAHGSVWKWQPAIFNFSLSQIEIFDKTKLTGPKGGGMPGIRTNFLSWQNSLSRLCGGGIR